MAIRNHAIRGLLEHVETIKDHLDTDPVHVRRLLDLIQSALVAGLEPLTHGHTIGPVFRHVPS
jgi:hypothetical protein